MSYVCRRCCIIIPYLEHNMYSVHMHAIHVYPHRHCMGIGAITKHEHFASHSTNYTFSTWGVGTVLLHNLSDLASYSACTVLTVLVEFLSLLEVEVCFDHWPHCSSLALVWGLVSLSGMYSTHLAHDGVSVWRCDGRAYVTVWAVRAAFVFDQEPRCTLNHRLSCDNHQESGHSDRLQIVWSVEFPVGEGRGGSLGEGGVAQSGLAEDQLGGGTCNTIKDWIQNIS